MKELKESLLKKFNFIKKKFTKSFDIILLTYLIFNVLYITIGSYNVVNYIISTLQFLYGYIIFLVINIFLIRFIIKNDKYKKSNIDFFLKAIIIFAIISTLTAYNIHTSVYGWSGRGEGLFAIAYYISLIFLASYVKKEHKKILVYAFLVDGFIQVIYCLCQKFGLFGVAMLLHKNLNQVYGFATHPNFFGTMMVICISYSIGLFIDSKKLTTTIIFAFLSCSFFTGMLLSSTLSSIVGLIAVLFVALIYCIKNKKIKKYILICILLGYVLSSIHFLNMTTVVKDLVKTEAETTNIAKGNMDDSYGTGRLFVWKRAVKEAPKYMIHGIGIDNFANILNGKPIENSSGYFDKAHNEYLQILITMGIFSLISYLCLHFIIVKDGLKTTFKNKEIYLLLPIIGYLVQSQFNISVLEVAPLFYMGLGLLVDRK